MSEDIYAVVRNGEILRSRAYLKKGHATLAANAYPNSREVKKGQVVWDGEEEVVLSLKEYNSLLHSASWLQCLEDAGVDNWSGIDYAYEMMNKGVDFDEL